MHGDQPRTGSKHVGEYCVAVKLGHRFDCSRPQLKRSVERQWTHMPIDTLHPGAYELEERVRRPQSGRKRALDTWSSAATDRIHLAHPQGLAVSPCELDRTAYPIRQTC